MIRSIILTLCLLGICRLLIFQKNQLYRNTNSVSNSWDLHLAHRYVGPDLVLNSLQRLLEDAPIR